jgi:hypothetical protein
MSDKDELRNLKELNEKIGSSLYLFYAYKTFVAISWKSDMDKFLSSSDCLVRPEDSDLSSASVIYGLVLDPTALPVEIDESLKMEKTYQNGKIHRHLWVVIEKDNIWDMIQLEEIEQVTAEIEKHLAADSTLSISNFGVIFGEKIPLSVALEKTGTSVTISKVYTD